MDLSCVLVTLGTLEMGHFAKVNLTQHLRHTKALFSKIKHEARNFVIFFKTSTNVLYFLTTVNKTQTAPTLMDLSCAFVTMDILEMELSVKVNRSLNSLI
jgi:hypothetical protein